MTDSSKMTDEQFAGAVADVIADTFGVDGLARFVTMFCPIPGKDYIRDNQMREQDEANLATRNKANRATGQAR